MQTVTFIEGTGSGGEEESCLGLHLGFPLCSALKGYHGEPTAGLNQNQGMGNCNLVEQRKPQISTA